MVRELLMARVVLNRAELDDLLRSEGGEVGQYVVKKCQQVVNQARSVCPVDTGNLRGSITYEIAREGNEIIGRVGTNVPYAIFVHEGTRYMPARPFLREGLAAIT